MRALRLLAFPALEIAAFLHFAAHRPGAFAALGVAAVFACFTLHVAIHELVHRPLRSGARVLQGGATLLAGLPFHGYLWHHLNHHRHVNSLEDFSTTWRSTPAGPVARGLLSYAFGWPLWLGRSQRIFHAEIARREVPTAVVRGIRWQQALLALFVIALAVASPRAALGYVAMVYVSWVLIAAQNYGQHPPRDFGSGLTTTYPAPFYNAITANNGLHHEHHRDPSRAALDLRPDPSAPRVARPHLLAP